MKFCTSNCTNDTHQKYPLLSPVQDDTAVHPINTNVRAEVVDVANIFEKSPEFSAGHMTTQTNCPLCRWEHRIPPRSCNDNGFSQFAVNYCCCLHVSVCVCVFVHYAEHAQRVCAAMGETTPLLQRDKERERKRKRRQSYMETLVNRCG